MLNVELEKAIELMVQTIEEVSEFDDIVLIDACGRISGDDIYAPMNNPPFDRSPLDGYALIAEDTKGASKDDPKVLTVIDAIYAGEFSEMEIKKGQAMRIMTGAKIPKGADCVIRQEQTNYEDV